MRLYQLAALAAFAFSLHAQTTVTGPALDMAGAVWGGKITLRATSVVCPTGILGPSLKTIPVVGGVFSQVLCPGIYSVRYQGTNASRSAYWTVPDTGLPVIIKEIESGAMPTPLIHFSYSLISGLAPGDLIYGSAVGMARLPAPANGSYSIQWTNGVPSYVAGGGGGGGTWGTITGTLASQTDLQAVLGGCLSGTLTWSQIASGICDGGSVTGVTTNHAAMSHLDYATSGHTGFQAAITGAPGIWPTLATVATSGSYTDLSNKPAAASLPATVISSSSPITVAAEGGDYYCNVAGGCTFNLPTITGGMVGTKFCFFNADTRAGVITLRAPASTSISILGAAGTAAGALASGGALGDGACVKAFSTTGYKAVSGPGTWTAAS